MGLVGCVDCGASVSDRAASCPQCGGPIGAGAAEVRVRFAVQARTLVNNCTVMAGGKVVSQCKQGETAVFTVSGPTEIKVKVTGWFGQPTIIAKPGDRFEVGNRAAGKIYIAKVDVL